VGYSFSATNLALAVTLAAIVVWCFAVYDFSRTDEADLQTFGRTVWLVVLLLGGVLGALLWLGTGRRRTH
jgi:hypothetical protein